MKFTQVKIKNLSLLIILSSFILQLDAKSKDPVDYVNPYIGNISHLLVPTYPTVHLPNSMLRVYPERDNYTTDLINGLPVAVGSDKFIHNLDQTFREPLGMGRSKFYSFMGDHTGNVGQFSMANEPSLHIPYLYNYAGQPWKTQKRIRTLLKEWFRNDLMGI